MRKNSLLFIKPQIDRPDFSGLINLCYKNVQHNIRVSATYGTQTYAQRPFGKVCGYHLTFS
ncbi:MAG: hypothetical protein GXO87_00715 [Chlorobi bacterium]|nr:hypothetical protein [Chlorobiota bacterium]